MVSTLDLASGYWQIKMDEIDKIKTTFTTHRGLFQFMSWHLGFVTPPRPFKS